VPLPFLLSFRNVTAYPIALHPLDHRARVDTWVREYNQEREHSGKYCIGKTPMQTFLDSTHLAREKMLDRLTVGDASDTAGLRATPERSPQERRAGAARLTAA
jgi:hypothetical protein